MPICKLNDAKDDCVYDPNLYYDDLDDDSKEKCYQDVPNGCRLQDRYQVGPQLMNIEQDGGRRRRRKSRKSRKGRKGRKARRTHRR